MSNLFSGDKLKSDLELVLPSCKKVVVVSAFISKVGFEWLNNLVVTNQPSAILVGRLTPSDFLTGASDLETIKTALSEGYTVKALSNLHAKIYQIDDDLIFNGSANLTGKGLSIVSESNYEACTKVVGCIESNRFIENIVSAAVPITSLALERMELFLDRFEGLDMVGVPATWPLDILSQPSSLFVSDFPLTQPGYKAYEYELNPSLPFAQIENAKEDFALASSLFKQTKAYRWIKALVNENESERDLGFGKISSLLHDELADDPAPYRQEIKNLQANLYSYLKLYASDEIVVYVPGRRSEVLRVL
ncbi:phospholipase D-like domain-containing protein [Pseudoalteromonas sp. 2CM39R]|uniref:phospholipase D-like domain-containing protein n=1 Tax=Pseudoalteromonas sp. 2CM39R TaxID=2929856 RepID=UPI0020C06601|nr:phospholipase D-like domain-containing protein [Pseudoalteromonas sp. 2CM39R]MCK8123736.1 phospholipase D-like domain-containing protein [Pseudoalteromonas sp. 2CM39R]